VRVFAPCSGSLLTDRRLDFIGLANLKPKDAEVFCPVDAPRWVGMLGARAVAHIYVLALQRLHHRDRHTELMWGGSSSVWGGHQFGWRLILACT
jgi:hypothetical protein